jgi:putative DNA primase/helicase
MDALHPTLLLDEIDHALRASSNPDLLAILRASHRRRTAHVVRLVPTRDGDWKPQIFSAWCTYGYTATGKIEEALHSRAITVMLVRAKPGELAKLRRLTDGTSQVLLDCGRKFARWAADQVTLPDAEVPPGISHRDQDNWQPLCRLAAAAGNDWPQRTQCAAETINGITVAIGDVVPLLRDIREAFGARDRMATELLVAALLAIAEPSRRAGHRGARAACGTNFRPKR